MTTVPSYDPSNLFAQYRFMRENMPVFYHEAQNTWIIFRYDDVEEIVHSPTLFSSNVFAAMPQVGPLAESFVHTDPPRHRQLRSLVTQAFTPKRVADLEPRIAQIAHELIDAVADQGHMELINDFAYPLPVIVIAELLGIAPEDRASFRRWSDALITQEQGAGLEIGYLREQPEMFAYFQTVIEERRKRPQEDLISTLVTAEVDGQRLSDRDIQIFCGTLLFAGNETTRNLIGTSILSFDEYGVMEQITQEPALLPTAIEEVLRYRSSVQTIVRVVTTDTVFRGQQMRAGQHISLHLGSANRDETHFTDPEVFNIRRSPNRHLAFGYGAHFCLGAPLARLEARVGLSILLQRLKHIRREPDAQIEPVPPMFYGVKNLPLTFQL